jgi:hypothetical protein
VGPFIIAAIYSGLDSAAVFLSVASAYLLLMELYMVLGLPATRRRAQPRTRTSLSIRPLRLNDSSRRGGFGRPAHFSISLVRLPRRAMSFQEIMMTETISVAPNPSATASDWEAQRLAHERLHAELHSTSCGAAISSASARRWRVMATC